MDEIKKLKIGIDIDEVVAEYIKEFLIFLEKTRGKKILYEDIFDYGLEGPLKMTQQEIWDLLKEHISDEVIINLNLVDYSKDSIKKLMKNHELYFITSRHPNTKKATIFFFEKHFPKNNFNILFSGDAWENGNKTKAEFCNYYQINCLIEDNPNYARECSEKGIFVFLLDKPWNRKLDESKCENIVRVRSWKEILEKINLLENKT